LRHRRCEILKEEIIFWIKGRVVIEFVNEIVNGKEEKIIWQCSKPSSDPKISYASDIERI
jgi:hypothetical protein